MLIYRKLLGINTLCSLDIYQLYRGIETLSRPFNFPVLSVNLLCELSSVLPINCDFLRDSGINKIQVLQFHYFSGILLTKFILNLLRNNQWLNESTCSSKTFDTASQKWHTGSVTWDHSVKEGESWWEGGRDRRAVRQSSRVRKEMRRRDSQSCESYSATNQLTGLCQTNSGVADSGFLIQGQGLWAAISSSWLVLCYLKPTQL